MKYTFVLLHLLILVGQANSQRTGIGTVSPHPSALLEVASNSRGMTVPRLTTAQRNAIASPAKGLLVYDTNDDALYQFNGSAWAIVGNPGGNGITLPYSHSSASAGTLFSVSNTGSASSILATSQGTSTVALEGIANGTGGYGLAGHNTGAIGFGVGGEAIDNAAISGTTNGTGVGLRGNSPSGYALFTDGRLRFAGGSMAPEANRVLTSIDADGNARWQVSSLEKIAFSLENPVPYNNYPANQTNKVHFGFKTYDLGGHTQTASAFIPLQPLHSTFTVPVTGVYAFQLNLWVQLPSNTYCDYAGAEIKLDRGGSLSTLFTTEQYFSPTQNRDFMLRGTCQKRLQAGDVIFITLRQTNSSNAVFMLLGDYGRTVFSGRLVSAE